MYLVTNIIDESNRIEARQNEDAKFVKSTHVVYFSGIDNQNKSYWKYCY